MLTQRSSVIYHYKHNNSRPTTSTVKLLIIVSSIKLGDETERGCEKKKKTGTEGVEREKVSQAKTKRWKEKQTEEQKQPKRGWQEIEIARQQGRGAEERQSEKLMQVRGETARWSTTERSYQVSLPMRIGSSSSHMVHVINCAELSNLSPEWACSSCWNLNWWNRHTPPGACCSAGHFALRSFRSLQGWLQLQASCGSHDNGFKSLKPPLELLSSDFEKLIFAQIRPDSYQAICHCCTL